jgi:catechol 2,3-dioxygenase-like lactoylglutathione lyase family enzyme
MVLRRRPRIFVSLSALQDNTGKFDGYIVRNIGLGCRDAETTWHFYEDSLGMPLVLAMLMPDPYRDDRQEHCHFFFEVGSGTCLSFFDHPRAFTEGDFRPCTGFLRHIAIEVAEDQLVQDFRQRLEKAGIAAHYIDHDIYHSLYFTDPNGHNLEITFRPESNVEFMGKSRKVAHQIFEGWTAKRASYPTLPDGDV